jgi:hypothetical protein
MAGRDKKLRGRYRKVAAAFVALAMDNKGMTCRMESLKRRIRATKYSILYIMDVDLGCGCDFRNLTMLMG